MFGYHCARTDMSLVVGSLFHIIQVLVFVCLFVGVFCLYTTCVPTEAKGVFDPKTRITVSCELLCGYWEGSLHPLE